MSTPIVEPQQQQPPPTTATQQAYKAHSGHGSVGAVIAVVAVITILGLIAGMIGRLCSGRRIMGYGQYDFEGWLERKCASCIDGRVEPPTSRIPQENAGGGGGDAAPVAGSVESQQKTEEDAPSQHNPHQSAE